MGLKLGSDGARFLFLEGTLTPRGKQNRGAGQVGRGQLAHSGQDSGEGGDMERGQRSCQEDTRWQWQCGCWAPTRHTHQSQRLLHTHSTLEPRPPQNCESPSVAGLWAPHLSVKPNSTKSPLFVRPLVQKHGSKPHSWSSIWAGDTVLA